MLKRFCAVFALVLATSGCGTRDGVFSQLKEKWDPANDPFIMLPNNYVFEFDALPLNGALQSEPWADSYWPSKHGGLAQRWIDGVDGHRVTPVRPEAAKMMASKEIAHLSPAEKFDIFVGDDEMSLFNNEILRTHPSDGPWFGICHGWAAASIAFKEPKAVVVKGPSGIEVPFASSDIKALLSLHSAEYAAVSTKFLASRCNDDLSKNPNAGKNPECRDVNAGAFHLVLANLIGRMKEGFAADVTRGLEVWNQPISGYKTRVIGESRGRSPGADYWTFKEVTVETEMFYGAEIPPSWESTGSNMRSKVYKYRLEISRRGRIVGGEWLTDDRPDFMWQNSHPKLVDSGSDRGVNTIAWSQLQKIYDAGIAATADVPDPTKVTR